MSRKLRVFTAGASPRYDLGHDVPQCDAGCGHYDGKRCRLLGFRVSLGSICEPAVRELCAERDEAVRLLRMLDRPDARHPDVAEFLDGLEEGQ